MPPMIPTPVSVRQDRERGLEQEFELDIRISAVEAPTPLKAPTRATGGCCTEARSCFGCGEVDFRRQR